VIHSNENVGTEQTKRCWIHKGGTGQKKKKKERKILFPTNRNMEHDLKLTRQSDGGTERGMRTIFSRHKANNGGKSSLELAFAAYRPGDKAK